MSEDTTEDSFLFSESARAIETANNLEQKKKRRAAVVWSGWSFAGYVWDVFTNVLVILIVLSVYTAIGNYSNNYEVDVIIFSTLVLIYLCVVNVGAALGQTYARGTLMIYAQNNRVLTKLNQQPSDEEEIEEAEFRLDKARVKYYLNSAFNSLIFLIAAYNLLNAIGIL